MIHNTYIISIVAAMDEKRGIGKNDRIPWHIRDDLIKLKRLTKDNVVILGRKSYDSMVGYYDKTGRPMPGKIYLVITRDKDYIPTRANAKAVNSLAEALDSIKYYVLSSKYGEVSEKIQNTKYMIRDTEHEVFVIGGGKIFEQTIDIADKLYLTIVEGDFHCDTFFPEYSEFEKVVSEESGESEGHKYKFLELER